MASDIIKVRVSEENTGDKVEWKCKTRVFDPK